jgi:hypothetical protein
MSQSTDDLTRSELRAIRGHYRRRVYVAFLIPALIAVAQGLAVARQGPDRIPRRQDQPDRGPTPLGLDDQGGVGRRRPVRHSSRRLQESRHHLQIATTHRGPPRSAGAP